MNSKTNFEKIKFGNSPHEIDDLANKVLTGGKTATSSLLPAICMFCILIAGCTQQGKTAMTAGDSIITASSAHEMLETGVDCCYLSENGDTIVPYGKYRYAGSDTIIQIGFVLDNTGYAAINNKGERLFAVYAVDNGPDYVKEGLFRITDNKGLIGFADTTGKIIIKPQFAFAFPFENDTAKVTFTGKQKLDSEYYYWDSDTWYYLTRKGGITVIRE